LDQINDNSEFISISKINQSIQEEKSTLPNSIGTNENNSYPSPPSIPPTNSTTIIPPPPPQPIDDFTPVNPTPIVNLEEEYKRPKIPSPPSPIVNIEEEYKIPTIPSPPPPVLSRTIPPPPPPPLPISQDNVTSPPHSDGDFLTQIETGRSRLVPVEPSSIENEKNFFVILKEEMEKRRKDMKI